MSSQNRPVVGSPSSMVPRSVRPALTSEARETGQRELGSASNAAAERVAFRAAVSELFASQFQRVYRVLQRLSGEPDVAADIAQEAFVRLHERGVLPEEPPAWLLTVALNQFRNRASTRSRRLRLLTAERAANVLGDPPASPAEGIGETALKTRVRVALTTLTERDRRLLLLCAEGYRYREIAAVLGLNEASVGTLLSRAKRAFRDAYGDDEDAS